MKKPKQKKIIKLCWLNLDLYIDMRKEEFPLIGEKLFYFHLKLN